MLQSTHPCGVRLIHLLWISERVSASIHAPVWGATQQPQSPASIQTIKSVREWFNRAQLQADALKYIRKNYGDRGNVEVSKDTQSLLNYATVLNKAVKAGKLSTTKARELYSRMLNAKGEARLQLWQETADLFDRLDYKYTIHSRVKNQED